MVRASQNWLVRLLTTDKPQNMTRLMVLRRPFGMIHQLRRLNIGLGPVNKRFQAIEEEDYFIQVVEEEEFEIVGH